MLSRRRATCLVASVPPFNPPCRQPTLHTCHTHAPKHPNTAHQVSVELPDMDAEPGTITLGFRAAFGWSDFLWRGIFDKLPAAKAAKTEGATDFKLVVQALLAGE